MRFSRRLPLKRTQTLSSDSQNCIYSPAFILIIPVYNEQRHLPTLLQDIQTHQVKLDLLFVDDGSTDETELILQNAGVPFIRHAANRGKGAALVTGLSAAEQRGYSWAITMDGDGQHSPDHLQEFIDVCRMTSAQLIIGNRQNRHHEGMPMHRQLSNSITSVLVSLFSGVRVHDSQSGYRAYRLTNRAWRLCRETGFQFESEVILRLGKTGAKIVELPIRTVYAGQSSRMRLFADTFKFIGLLLRSMGWQI